MKHNPDITLMAAAEIKNLEDLPPGPWMASVKIDGIRAYVALDSEGTPRVYSRTHKLIPNPHIQMTYGVRSKVGYEGELNLGPLATFNEVQSWVMSKTLEPEFLEANVSRSRFTGFGIVGEPLDSLMHGHLRHTAQHWVANSEEAKALWNRLASNHPTITFEGLMFRKADAPYKFGRCTTKEATFFKWKAKKSSEYIVVGYEEAIDKKGSPKSELGSLLCRSSEGPNGLVFGVGTGFSSKQRKDLWGQGRLIGRQIEVEYLNLSDLGVPRHPVFKGFKDEQG